MEAIAVAVIVAQLAEMRLAVGRLGKRVDCLEAKASLPSRIISAGIPVMLGLTAYLVTR